MATHAFIPMAAKVASYILCCDGPSSTLIQTQVAIGIYIISGWIHECLNPDQCNILTKLRFGLPPNSFERQYADPCHLLGEWCIGCSSRQCEACGQKWPQWCPWFFWVQFHPCGCLAWKMPLILKSARTWCPQCRNDYLTNEWLTLVWLKPAGSTFMWIHLDNL